MSRARILAVAAAGLLLAAPAPPAAADGLAQFQDMLGPAPNAALSYESGKGLGDNGFVLEGVTITPPPDATEGVKSEPIHIDRVTVEDFDFASYRKNETPNFARLRAEGISINAKSFDAFDLRELTGRDTVMADFQLDYRVDPQRQTMAVNRLELDLRGLARIEVSMALDGFDPSDADAAESASLRTASLIFEDRSLLGTVLPAAARARGIDPEKIAALAEEILDSLRAGQQTAATAVLDALAGYVADYPNPKGPLRITVNPPNKIPLAALGEMKDPEEALKRLGLVVSYVSVRPPGSTGPTNPTR